MSGRDIRFSTKNICFLDPQVPGSSQTKYEVELQHSLRRSHAAAISHRVRQQEPLAVAKRVQKLRRRKVKSEDKRGRESSIGEGSSSEDSGHAISAPLTVLSGVPRHEVRSLRFFLQKTVNEWSGWQDSEFWIRFALPASFECSALRHALVGLATCHEFHEAKIESSRRALRQTSIYHGQQALRCLNDDYERLPTSAILASYVVFSTLAARIDGAVYLHTLKRLTQFFDQLKQPGRKLLLVVPSDEHYVRHYLEPMIERQRSRFAHFTDFLWNLAEIPASYFYVAHVSVPEIFADLKHARDVLDMVLYFATYRYKINGYTTSRLTADASDELERWYQALQLFQDIETISEEDMHSLKILRVCAKINGIMIRTMNTKTEMVFDDYIDVYEELADVFENVIAFERRIDRPPTKFGVDGNFLIVIGNTAMRFCRDPTVRHKLIQLLKESNRMESWDNATAWSLACELTQSAEESGIDPPPSTCHDIPEHNRLRLIRAQYWLKKHEARLHYIAGGSEDSRVRVLPISRYNRGDGRLAPMYSEEEVQKWQDGVSPDLDCGRGYYTWWDSQERTYYTTRASEFYFPLPRN